MSRGARVRVRSRGLALAKLVTQPDRDPHLSRDDIMQTDFTSRFHAPRSFRFLRAGVPVSPPKAPTESAQGINSAEAANPADVRFAAE